MTTKQFKNVITKQLSMMYNYHFEKNGIKKASTKSFNELSGLYFRLHLDKKPLRIPKGTER